MFAQTNICLRRDSWDTHIFSIGFRLKVFAQVAILCFIVTIQHEIDIRNILHAVLPHLSNAFDSLSHHILSKTFSRYIFVFNDTNRGKICNRSIATSVCKWCSFWMDWIATRSSPRNSQRAVIFQLVCEWSSKTYERNCSYITVG